MKSLSFLLLVLLMISCKNQEDKKIEEVAPVPTSEIEKEEVEILQSEKEISMPKTDQSENPILGSYVGYFMAAAGTDAYRNNGSYSNKINISIDHITEDSIYGHSVVAGNSRSFKGLINNETHTAKVYEPGDDKYDGGFEFSFLKDSEKLKGIWKANNVNLAVNKREYELEKKTFSYNPDANLDAEFKISYSNTQFEDSGELEAIRPKLIMKLNASTQQLSNKNIENLSKGELEVLRNLIYARHGYSFKNRKMRYFFDSSYISDWYIPVSTDIRDQLTDLEKKNIDLIKRYEQHAERYYDYFGR